MPKDKKENTGLGRSLMKKNRNKKKELPDALFQHMDDIDEEKIAAGAKLKSVIDQNNLTEFLQVAELQARDFEAARDVKVTKSSLENDKRIVIDMNNMQTVRKKAYDMQLNEYLKNLRIPRRPKWDTKMSAQELATKENENFLNWRRELAKVEETHYELTLTPYERNVEVWRQLWRVLDKSDIVVQIVDGRDPLFFRCKDLEDYSKEVDQNKENILLINKSDLLSDEIRQHWSEYFKKNSINHIFFSAKKEQEKIDKDEKSEERPECHQYQNTPTIVNRSELLSTLKSIVLGVRERKLTLQTNKEANLETNAEHPLAEKKDESIVTLGMVGYPNVGKSSVINVLCQKKLVGVAAQPGKTKHFQTHFIEKDLLLCDCPGLVFPSASSSRAEMVCNGVLPIDTIKDYISPVDLICQRVEKRVLERLYKIKIDLLLPTGSQFLQIFARSRGHFTGSALPDQAKVAKRVLKDLVNGKLLMCKLSPDYDPLTHPKINNSNHFLEEDEEEKPEIKEKKANEESSQEEHKKNESTEKTGKNEELEGQAKEVDDDEFFEGDALENALEDDFTEEEILDLLEGKKVKGIKLNKIRRREIKHSLKRGEMPSLKGILNILHKAEKLAKPVYKGKYAMGTV